MRWMLGVLCVCGMVLGCSSEPGPSPQVSETASAPPLGPPPPSPPPPEQVDTGAAVEQPAPASPASPEQVGTGAAVEQPAPAESEPEQPRGRPAEVGVGRKGHGYGSGPVAAALATRWRAAERLIFDVQIPHAMNLFKATHGRAPASHEQFIKEIIDANHIRLPELRHGQRYSYDPATEQLLVVDSEG